LRILLTGATGLIGTQLGIKLVRSGHDLTVLSRRGNSRDLAFPARCLAWDHLNPLPESVLFAGDEAFDAVIHLAGETVAQRWNKSIKQKIRDSRVKSTKALIASFPTKTKQPKIWLNASAIGIYGDTKDNIVDEKSPAATGFLPDVCSEWEKTLDNLSPQTRKIALRFGVVFSNEGGALPKMMQPFIYGLGGPIGAGHDFLSWIHIDDAVNAITYTLDHDTVTGPVNVVSPNAVTNAELTKELASICQLPAIIPAPKFMLRLVLGEMSSVILSSCRVKPTQLLESGFKFLYSDLGSALKDLLSYCQPRGTRIFVARQWVKGDPATHFPFFSAAENLETITPP
jgi:uncharacterized protein